MSSKGNNTLGVVFPCGEIYFSIMVYLVFTNLIFWNIGPGFQGTIRGESTCICFNNR